MEGMLRTGTELVSEGKNRYTVRKMLGAGGQGEVYEVVCEGDKKHYALKWYYKHTATNRQKKILDKLIERGKPDDSFLWPQDLIRRRKNEPFGYIMPLRPKHYKSIVDLMKRKAEPSFYYLCKAAYNLTQGYRMLHKAGYQYRDISFGNVFFDPKTGDVMICDNDNVVPNGTLDGGVYGTPRFMAPEIVRGEKKSSRNTDLYSLAVLLFYMFMLNHPLEGKQEAKIRCMDIHAMNRLYGTNPVFIWDPKDLSNRPLAGYQDNAIIYWELYPKALKELFIRSFTEGLTEPARRVTENMWLSAFSNLMSGIMICGDCGAEIFFDKYKEENDIAHTCWNCHKEIKVPSKLVIGKNNIILTSKTKLYTHHILGNYDMNTVVGEVAVNPNNPAKWGLKNLSESSWRYEKSDGTQVPVKQGQTAAIAKDVSIDFGEMSGHFE
ncbi:MAG: serine/threonine-protein kinase [Lachnospiraceae bacterium]|nr:serine/threonine-protein kinase [Lachnospiraceae bacterium]